MFSCMHTKMWEYFRKDNSAGKASLRIEYLALFSNHSRLFFNKFCAYFKETIMTFEII